MALQMARPYKHPKTDVYYYRQKVPADLRSLLGDKIVSRSLRTKDPSVARVRNAEEVRKQAMVWETYRKKPEPLTGKQIVALAGVLYREMSAKLDWEPGEPEIWTQILRIANGVAGDDDKLNQWFGRYVDDLLLQEGIVTDEASRLRLIYEVDRTYRQMSEFQMRRAEGDYRPDPDAERFPPLSPPNGKGGQEEGGITIRSLFKLWERDHLADGKAPGTVGDFRQKVESLIDFVGHDDPRRLTGQEIVSWCDHLRHEENLKAATVATKYLAAVRVILNVAVEKKKLESNPASGIVVRYNKKRRRARPKGFTEDEARAILRASLMADSLARWSETSKLAIRWGPWICALTGARITEVMQLRREDLIEVGGVSCLRITPDAGSVKSGNFRIVPVHPQLQDMGLAAMIGARSEGPIFFKPRADTTAQNSAGNVGSKVAKWVRRVVGISDLRVQPNHAWRHRFKTLARDVGMAPEYMDAIQGHEDGRAASDYGETTMKALYREICRLPRYELDAPAAQSGK